MTEVEAPMVTTEDSLNIVVSNDENEDDEEDEMADLFSFGTGNMTGTANDAHDLGTASESAVASSENIDLTRSESFRSNDSFMNMLDAESTAILDMSHVSDSYKESYDQETLDMLQWLDRSATAHREIDGTTEEIVFGEGTDNDDNDFAETETTPVVTVEITPPQPTFDSLEDALHSNKSTKEQIRILAENKLDTNCKNDSFKLFDVDDEKLRPEFYCRMISGKNVSDAASSSLADSFDYWRENFCHKEKELNSRDDDDETVVWIRSQATVLSKNISNATGRSETQCEGDLLALLLHHHQNNINSTANSRRHHATQINPVTSNPSNNEESEDASDTNNTPSKPVNVNTEDRDLFLPAVAATILSANIPVTAAFVVLGQMIPNYMPLLALMPSERWQAALLLHAEFYFLACYHVPFLVIHLDRYLPGWQWPKIESSSTNVDLASNKENLNSVSKGRNLMKQGQIPPSWLMCHLAGECNVYDNSSLMLDAKTILRLWDGILASSNSSHNTLRFFLTIALLEQVADKLIRLTGDELAKELQSIWLLPEKYFPEDLNWKESKWWSSAKALQKQTPKSVMERIQKSEDSAVQVALQQRRVVAEAEIQSRLDAEAAAHRLAQEVAAQQARERLSRARLVAFYRVHAPDKEGNIDTIMTAYNGRLHLLDQKLKIKYGVGFNPAVDPPKRNEPSNPDQLPRQSTPNLFLSTMNQSFQVVGMRKNFQTNVTLTDDASYALPKAKDQVSVSVAPDEVLPIVCWSKEATAARGVQNTLEATVRYWDNLKFYIVDSRTEAAAAQQGRLPTALELTPEFLMDPERILENEDRLESLRGACHIVVMGEGYSALPRLYNQKITPKLASLIREDEARTNGCALFFCKRGFPFVSVLEGGFAGALSWLYREGPNHHLSPSSVLVDYDQEESLFGKLEVLHNSSTTEKAQRQMQKLLETSLVTMTRGASQLERFTAASSDVTDNPAKDRTIGTSMPGFGLSLFSRGESSNEGAKNDEDINSNDAKSSVNQSGQADSSHTNIDNESKQPASSRFKGLGAALNSTMKTASSIAAGSQGVETGEKTTTVPTIPSMLKRNPFARFGGNTSGSDDGKPKSDGPRTVAGSPSVSVPGLAGFNQFRKTTIARMQQATNSQQLQEQQQQPVNHASGNRSLSSGTIVDIPPPRPPTSDNPQIRNI